MGSQAINHISGSGNQETSTLTVGAAERVGVRLSRFDDGCSAKLKISGNSHVTFEDLYRMNTVFDAIPEGHVVSVITNRVGSSGGVEGVIETYT